MRGMKNAEIARILYSIAEMLEMQGVQFKPRAYQRAARTVEGLSEELLEIHAKGGRKALEALPGIGEAIAKKIEEMLRTGRLRYYEELKAQFPIDVEGLMSVPGMGPKRVKLLYDKLGIKDVAGLRKAAQEHQLAGIPGFGEKMEEDILRGVELAGAQRATLGSVEEAAEGIRSRLMGLGSVKRVEIAGSYRRGKETIGDLDFLIISSRPAEVMEFACSMEGVQHVIARGKTKSAVILKGGMHVDFRVLGEGEFGSALQYFTGSKDHNVALRRLANSKGMTLSEYGLFTIRGKRRVAGKTEKGIYSRLGLGYIEPELRENSGELEAAARGFLPKLVELKDIRGDLQTQTEWSDGNASIEDMAKAAMALGHGFMAVTDHGGSFLKVANALDARRLAAQGREIDRLNEKLPIRILKGTEVDILRDGKLALPKKALDELDFVLGAVHSGFKSSEAEMTKRIVSAIEDYPVHALAHPTGRVINRRDPYAVDLEKVFDACRSTGTFLEIDGFPDRLDLKDAHIRAAKEFGCRFTVSTDAHSTTHMRYMKHAVAQARRGWLEAKDILNTYPIKRIERELARRK